MKNGKSDITEKVYPYQKMSAAKIVLGEIAVWFLFFLFYVMWTSGPASSFIVLIIALFLVLYPILAILLLLSPIILTTEIVISKGVLFKRRFRPITIQKVTDLKTREFRGKEVNITITGLTPEGEEIRKRIARTGGDVGKRWEEFKADLEKIKSK